MIDLLLENGKKRNVFCRINIFVSIDIRQIMFEAAINISIESIKNYGNIQRTLPLIYDHSLLKLLGWVTYELQTELTEICEHFSYIYVTLYEMVRYVCMVSQFVF